MITCADIVDRYKAKPPYGQLLLWREDEYTLRHTPFQSINKEFDKKAVILWHMTVYVPGSYKPYEEIKFEIYQTWWRALKNNFKYIDSSGYFPDTQQSTVDLRTVKKDPVEDQYAELMMWIPFIKPLQRNDRNYRVVSISDHTYAASGFYELYIDPVSEESELCKTSYGTPRIIERFKTILEAVQYIRINHYS